jgi:hypothetical protein
MRKNTLKGLFILMLFQIISLFSRVFAKNGGSGLFGIAPAPGKLELGAGAVPNGA